MDDWCGLHFNTIILIIVCAVNFFKVVSTLFTWAFLIQLWYWKRQRPRGNEELEDYRPMITVGDAIQSFLGRLDDTTKGMCLASQKDFQLRRGSWPTAGPRIWEGEARASRLKLASKDFCFTPVSRYYYLHIQLHASFTQRNPQSETIHTRISINCMSTNFRLLGHRGVALIIAVAGILGATMQLQISRGVNEDAQNLQENFGQVNSLYLVNILKQSPPLQFWGSVLFPNF
jgi:hypothetical protein